MSDIRELLSVPGTILDAIPDGVYVCDVDRTIVYWSQAAERLTGWRRSDMVGHHCLDSRLNHVDKDGHELCAREHCPLHRVMVTGIANTVPMIVFARCRDGQRLASEVKVAPIRNAAGEVIGGVEVFRDMSTAVKDLERARQIQSAYLEQELPVDPRVRFHVLYMPHDYVGGDFYAVKRLGPDQYAFCLADVTGHGVSAALFTMHLGLLTGRHLELLRNPATFLAAVNEDLVQAMGSHDSFATAICGVIEADSRTLRFASAGGPAPVQSRPDGTHEEFAASGLPLGLAAGMTYDEVAAQLDAGDSLFLFSDGATEVEDPAGTLLGTDGLMRILHDLGAPDAALSLGAVEQKILEYSNTIRLVDDVTIIQITFQR